MKSNRLDLKTDTIELMVNDIMDLMGSYELTLTQARSTELTRICTHILKRKFMYLEVQGFTDIPWPVVAAIHFRESSLNFLKHLHNGDPLTERTVQKPKGRPLTNPPFTWVESATDALSLVRKPTEWGLNDTCQYLERYNGPGYKRRGLASPYVWSWTTHYEKGLYQSDGVFNADKVDPRPGCIAILDFLSHMA